MPYIIDDITASTINTLQLAINGIPVGGGGGLEGSNYLYVAADGTPAENGQSLLDTYEIAKTTTPNGQALSSDNRLTILLAPGYYLLDSAFIMDTDYIDVVSLTGNKDVIFDLTVNPFNPTSELPNPYISITANDVFVKGLDSVIKFDPWWNGNTRYQFRIATNLNLLKIENCRGGAYSFGGDYTFSTPQIVSGIFIGCEGEYYSFGGGGVASGEFVDCSTSEGTTFGSFGTASGLFVNCDGGPSVFDSSFARQGTASGTFIDCSAGGGVAVSSTASGYFLRCRSNATLQGATITGKVYYCVSDTTTIGPVTPGGVIMYCIGNGQPNNDGFTPTNNI